MRQLRAWHDELGWMRFLARLSGAGALAGVAAWLLVYGLHLAFEVGKPTGLALLLAVPRGALFGAIPALLLGWYWKRSRP